MIELEIIKRTGKRVPFDKNKIIKVITKAYQTLYNTTDIPNFAATIADAIYDIAQQETEPLTVEDIQDLVEDYLTSYDKLLAKSYIRYRYKRGVMRSCSNEFIRSISEKLMAKDVQNSNANVDEFSFGGRVGEASNEMMKHYALDFCMSDMARRNHLNNEIYVHDLNAYAVGTHNCLSIPFDKLLAEGFNTRQTDVRPANSINTAFQLVAVIFQLQSLMQFGGVSATHLDWTMVPYVRKSFMKHWNDGIEYIGKKLFPANEWEYETEPQPIDEYIQYDDWEDIYKYAMDMTERELQQAVEGMYHNLNTLQSRSGNQLNIERLAG